MSACCEVKSSFVISRSSTVLLYRTCPIDGAGEMEDSHVRRGRISSVSARWHLNEERVHLSIYLQYLWMSRRCPHVTTRRWDIARLFASSALNCAQSDVTAPDHAAVAATCGSKPGPSGVTRAAVTRCRNWWCHPFYLKKWWPFQGCICQIFTGWVRVSTGD